MVTVQNEVHKLEQNRFHVGETDYKSLPTSPVSSVILRTLQVWCRETVVQPTASCSD